MPAVSVLMVFHRDTPFLRPAIASVLGQTWDDLELVLVDNGTELAPEMLGDLGRDARIRWVRMGWNDGIVVGHNAGVSAARGEFIALLDYDDIALPRRIERQIEKLRNEPRLGLVSSMAETIDERGVMIGREFSLVESEAQRAYSQYAAPVVTPAYMGRREIFEALAYREHFPLAADFDFLARAAERSQLAAVPEVLLHYRRYPTQTTNAHALEIERSRCLVRLLTAQRRAGRAEDLSLGSKIRATASAAAVCHECAQCCLAEEWFALAAYHARRAVALHPTIPHAARALALALRVFRRARHVERRLAIRVFLSGPVRALGVRPH